MNAAAERDDGVMMHDVKNFFTSFFAGLGHLFTQHAREFFIKFCGFIHMCCLSFHANRNSSYKLLSADLCASISSMHTMVIVYTFSATSYLSGVRSDTIVCRAFSEYPSVCKPYTPPSFVKDLHIFS